MDNISIDYAVVTYTLGIYAAIVVSPGPNFALVSRLALQGRKTACWGAICGLACVSGDDLCRARDGWTIGNTD